MYTGEHKNSPYFLRVAFDRGIFVIYNSKGMAAIGRGISLFRCPILPQILPHLSDARRNKTNSKCDKDY